MNIEIGEEPVSTLPAYGEVPITFLVKSRYRIEINKKGQSGILLQEEEVTPPYLKDYDKSEGEKPTRWQKQWDISNWGIFPAFEGTKRVGGAAVAWKTPEIYMLEDRDDVAALWDIRVHPDYRGQGIGTKLFKHAVDWARIKGCRLIKIETQNINIPACWFYENQGCTLGAINRYAYHDFPDEIQLIWYLEL